MRVVGVLQGRLRGRVMIDARLLAEVYRRPADKLAPAVGPMRAALEFADITTDRRLAHWLAQVGHESGKLVYTREIWGPTSAQVRYERRFDQPWPASAAQARQSAYAANRLAHVLGNSQPGDGKRFMGRGWIQTTGRANCVMTRERLRAALGAEVPDFEAEPTALERLHWAALSAAMYWRARGMNQWADAGDTLTLTKRINGGTNGLADRQLLLARAMGALALAAPGRVHSPSRAFTPE